MTHTRRSFLRNLALSAAGLYVAADLLEEPRRKIFALGGIGPDVWVSVNGGPFARRIGGVVPARDAWTHYAWRRSDAPGYTFGARALVEQPISVSDVYRPVFQGGQLIGVSIGAANSGRASMDHLSLLDHAMAAETHAMYAI